MTNYNDWEKRAKTLVEETEKDEEEEKKKADEALGLQDGPQGPPTAKAKAQREEMSGHSQGRKNFIAEQQAKEVVLTHEDAAEAIVITEEQAGNRALRFSGCKNVTYELPSTIVLVKLFVERCQNVTVKLSCNIKTSFVEINHSENVEVRALQPVATVQCDECTQGFTRIIYSEPEHMGNFYHQNSPALEVGVGGLTPNRIGTAGNKQLYTRPGPNGDMVTEDVLRGEKDFPINLGRPVGDRKTEPEAEMAPATEEMRARAEEKRTEGNEAFRASDFLQAAVYYTEAIQMCSDLHLAWANRAQCFLRTGQPEKALEDSTKCTELAPDYAKGWFRKGMALHALGKYGAAIPALGEAEKLDPKNDQIPEAIRMAQMMARKHGPGDS